MYEAGSFPISELSKTYLPTEINKAIQDMKSGKVRSILHLQSNCLSLCIR